MSTADIGGDGRRASATDVMDRPDGLGAEGVKEKAEQAAGTAADAGKQVAGAAAQEASEVADQAKQQAQQLLGEARSQLTEVGLAQRDQLAKTLGTLGDDLEQMAGQGGGLAAELVSQAAQQSRGLTSRLQGSDPAELLDEVRDFARRRPGTFLLGALAAGLVAGRVARSIQAANGSTTRTSTTPIPAQRAETPVSPAERENAPAPSPQAAALADFPADRPGDFR